MSPRGRAGFTLLEIAVALAITGIGMAACMQVFGGALRLQDRGARQTRAVIHARSEMDRLVFDPPESLSTEKTTADGYRVRSTVRAAKPPEVPEPPDDYTVDEENLPRWVEVAVTWQDGLGEKTYALHTVALRRDPDDLGKEQ